MSSNNSRKRWNLMNEIRNSARTRTHIYSLKNVFNDVTEPKKTANLLNYRFSELGKFILSDETSEYIDDFAGRSAKTFLIRRITEFECLQCIKKLNRNKPQGPSALPPWALKDAVSVVNKHLCFIINECINNSTFPEILKTADVTPIYKKNDPEEPDNYRPISITPCISKVIENLIKEQLTEYLQKNKLVSRSQNGFRKKHSTSDALVYTTEFIRHKTDQNEIVAAAFLDLSKAFDSINHVILLKKLGRLGVDSKSINRKFHLGEKTKSSN